MLKFSSICLQCPVNQYKGYFDNECHLCPTGARCISGKIYNLEGIIIIYKLILKNN